MHIPKPESEAIPPVIAAMPSPEKSPLEELNEVSQELRIQTAALIAERKSNELLRDRIKKIEENKYVYLLNLLDAGGTVADLAEKIRVLSALVLQRGTAGALTLRINASLMKDTCATLLFTPTVTLKEPKADAPATILYADAAGELSRKDPNQGELSL